MQSRSQSVIVMLIKRCFYVKADFYYMYLSLSSSALHHLRNHHHSDRCRGAGCGSGGRSHRVCCPGPLVPLNWGPGATARGTVPSVLRGWATCWQMSVCGLRNLRTIFLSLRCAITLYSQSMNYELLAFKGSVKVLRTHGASFMSLIVVFFMSGETLKIHSYVPLKHI